MNLNNTLIADFENKSKTKNISFLSDSKFTTVFKRTLDMASTAVYFGNRSGSVTKEEQKHNVRASIASFCLMLKLDSIQKEVVLVSNEKFALFMTTHPNVRFLQLLNDNLVSTQTIRISTDKEELILFGEAEINGEGQKYEVLNVQMEEEVDLAIRKEFESFKARVKQYGIHYMIMRTVIDYVSCLQKNYT